MAVAAVDGCRMKQELDRTYLRRRGITNLEIGRLVGRTPANVTNGLKAMREGRPTQAAGPLQLALAVLLEVDGQTLERVRLRLESLRADGPSEARPLDP